MCKYKYNYKDKNNRNVLVYNLYLSSVVLASLSVHLELFCLQYNWDTRSHTRAALWFRLREVAIKSGLQKVVPAISVDCVTVCLCDCVRGSALWIV